MSGAMSMSRAMSWTGAGGLRRLGARAAAFATAPAPARPLAAFRIGVAAVLLIQLVAVAPWALELYGARGLIQRPLIDASLPPDLPRVGWVADALAGRGVADADCVRGLCLAYAAGLACLLVGWRTRAAAAVAWAAHLALRTSGVAAGYGVDEFATIALFYCLWMPVGHALSLDVLAGRVAAGPTPGARLALRVLQVHLCIVYLSSGLDKAAGRQWWDGEAIWRALTRPDLGRFDFGWLAEVPWLPRLIGWGTLALEVGYAAFVWPSRTRRPWAYATIGLHLGIAATMGLVSFSALMAVLTGSAFLVAPGDRGNDPRPLERAPMPCRSPTSPAPGVGCRPGRITMADAVLTSPTARARGRISGPLGG